MFKGLSRDLFVIDSKFNSTMSGAQTLYCLEHGTFFETFYGSKFDLSW